MSHPASLVREAWILSASPFLEWALLELGGRVCGPHVRAMSLGEIRTIASLRFPRVAVICATTLGECAIESLFRSTPQITSRSLVLAPTATLRALIGRWEYAGVQFLSLSASMSTLERAISLLWNDLTAPPPVDPSALASPLDQLSVRERQLFELIACGTTLRSAATRMSISYKTADTYRTTIYRKLNIKSGRDAVRLAIREGLVSV